MTSSFHHPSSLESLGVSRETLARLTRYVSLLLKWNAKINLVGPASEAEIWHRHVYDCAQLFSLIPKDTTSLTDLGSGAGLPGLILAILGVPSVTLIEVDTRKAAFLFEAARITETSVKVITKRLETHPPVPPADIVTARALAPLPRLLGYAAPYLKADGTCFFLKGARVQEELAEARKSSWVFDATFHPSLSDETGTILQLKAVSHVDQP